jgi:hypothetical protein
MTIRTKDGLILVENGALGTEQACCCAPEFDCDCSPTKLPKCGPVFAVLDGQAYQLSVAIQPEGPRACENGSFASNAGERLTIFLSGTQCQVRDGDVFFTLGLWVVWRQRSGTCRGACGKFFLYEIALCTADGLCGTQQYTLTSSGNLSGTLPGGFNFAKCPNCVDANTGLECECEYTDCNTINEPSYVGFNPLP